MLVDAPRGARVDRFFAIDVVLLLGDGLEPSPHHTPPQGG